MKEGASFPECERAYIRVRDAVRRGLEITFEEEGEAYAAWNYSELGPSLIISCFRDSSLYKLSATFWNYRQLPAH